MKLFKSLSLIAVLATSISYGMQHQQPIVFGGTSLEIQIRRDSFGNVTLPIPDIPLNKLRLEVRKLAQYMSDDEKGKACIIRLPHNEGNKADALRDAGFLPNFVNSDHVEWVLKNGSPMPEASTAAAGARVLVCRDNHEVLMIEDKGMKGKAVYPGGSVDPKELALDAACREIRKEVGLTIKPEDMQLIALVNRVKGNRYGYSDYCHYYMTRKFSGEVQIQESEVQQTFWAPLIDLANDDVKTVNSLTMSPTVKLLAGHIVKNYHTTCLKSLDPRQYTRPTDQQDKSDVMNINLFHFGTNNETNSNH